MKYYSKKEIERKKKLEDKGKYSFEYNENTFVITEKKTNKKWFYNPISLIYGRLSYDKERADKFYKFPQYVTIGLWEKFDNAYK